MWEYSFSSVVLCVFMQDFTPRALTVSYKNDNIMMVLNTIILRNLEIFYYNKNCHEKWVLQNNGLILSISRSKIQNQFLYHLIICYSNSCRKIMFFNKLSSKSPLNDLTWYNHKTFKKPTRLFATVNFWWMLSESGHNYGLVS